jgi:hypothetical protein
MTSGQVDSFGRVLMVPKGKSQSSIVNRVHIDDRDSLDFEINGSY